MQELEDRIRHDGIVKAGNVLKVDAFLNHQCDVELFDHMGAEWARLFEGVEGERALRDLACDRKKIPSGTRVFGSTRPPDAI